MELGLAPSSSLVGFLSGKERDAYDEITPALKPYDHQRRAVNENVKAFEAEGFRADFMEMGTGKTKTTFDTWMVLLARGLVDTLVVVCPKNLMSTWGDEERIKHLTIPHLFGMWDGKKTKKSVAEFDVIARYKKPLLYVFNIEAFQHKPLNDELVRRVSALMRTRAVFMAVDESSMIKSHDSNRSIAIRAMGKLAKYKVILTGTEISKSPLDLFMQFDFLKPGFWNLKSFFMFKQKYAVLEDGYGSGGRTFKKVVGYQKIDDLMSRIAPYTTRALKKDCLDLPEKIYIEHKVELTEAQEKAYSQLKKYLATQLESGEVLTIANKVALFTKFRQITGGTILNEQGDVVILDKNPAKLSLLDDLVQDTDEQMIVWCCFSAEIALVAERLREYGEVVTFDGSTEQEERDVAKKAFQHGEVRFFVGNPKAGAFGLNLQNCHIQAFYSQDTSPQVNWQCEDRSHRSGQKYPCVYHFLMAKDTVDERVHALIRESKNLLDMLREGRASDIIDLI